MTSLLLKWQQPLSTRRIFKSDPKILHIGFSRHLFSLKLIPILSYIKIIVFCDIFQRELIKWTHTNINRNPEWRNCFEESGSHFCSDYQFWPSKWTNQMWFLKAITIINFGPQNYPMTFYLLYYNFWPSISNQSNCLKLEIMPWSRKLITGPNHS